MLFGGLVPGETALKFIYISVGSMLETLSEPREIPAVRGVDLLKLGGRGGGVQGAISIPEIVHIKDHPCIPSHIGWVLPLSPCGETIPSIALLVSTYPSSKKYMAGVIFLSEIGDYPTWCGKLDEDYC